MTYLFGVFLCLSVVAQQGSEPKPAPSVQPSSDVLVRALLAADGAQNKTEKTSAEELKTMIEREIAKSAMQASELKKKGELQTSDPMVLIDGAVYLKFGNTIYPMPGGGASGCFDPNAATKLEQARLKFVEQLKTEKESGKKSDR
ncbi:MAG TPA: hypothetical protein PLD20_18935 [Blastocatellia bacterium]|nr:hypothetical protein [Blastocatellia bacterium]HMX24885.1 hypothetical protein [Blastocatellia bacterium]HMY75963.1 hypothetical protein [Blastocatellia bacterium]HMZ20021.1 hypothetical protein [Blastocatellia bacterium]HNG32813.1 hypothetical protein [Blastocatellia bacterium]